MPVITKPHEFLESDVYIDLNDLLGRGLYLKCDGFNFGGSVKLRTAASMVAAAGRDGLIGADSILVESSSGNLGIALSVVAASIGRRFTCVIDPRCNRQTADLMRALGAEVVTVTEPSAEGGFLRARQDHVRRLCEEDGRYLWLNQYLNHANWSAHYETTAPEIAKQFPHLDVLFVGVGTGGTVMGCSRYFRDNGADTRIVAVDAVGSVTFGLPAGPRLIPGLGAGVRPPMVDTSLIDDVVHVAEIDTIRACRRLSAQGFLLGGSSGTVLSGALSWLDRNDPGRELSAVAIAPDLGERYVDTIYNDSWVAEHFGAQHLRSIA
ncbi:2,3-diaminopropionate biosynthesis protein SbnA [Amycolatopsis sp. GM8]|uniref:2,3-diaminopropionate biosynthesis protein SbnA n=1 Tax=Amycolatopsis sp. GM8 TaxID=2896530 RepID=UPI001F00D0C2|nr:2,3-diaminopropionate biosynthesis protein SbnA [Amycolatopsis sp. GM8]